MVPDLMGEQPVHRPSARALVSLQPLGIVGEHAALLVDHGCGVRHDIRLDQIKIGVLDGLSGCVQGC